MAWWMAINYIATVSRKEIGFLWNQTWSFSSIPTDNITKMKFRIIETVLVINTTKAKKK